MNKFTLKIIKSKRVKAQGLVEFALVLPVLLLLMFGIFEFGRMLFIYSMVFTSSREAARYGSAAGVVGGVTRYNDCDGIKAAAKRVGSLAGIQDADISIRYDSGPGTPILPPSDCPIPDEILVMGGVHRIIVEVEADFSPVVPLVNAPPTEIKSQSARTILSSMSVKSEIPVVPTPASGEVHVGDLDATSSDNGDGTWKASVTITVHDAFENPVQGATIIGGWLNAAVDPPVSDCVTDLGGKCTTASGAISEGSVDFTVTNIVHPYHVFSPGDSHDPDGDSDGDTITVSMP